MERTSASKIAQWHPTSVLLPGKSHGRRSLVGCSPWGLRVGHDWEASLSLLTFMHWRRKWQPTPGFLPGESQGRGGLVGCRLWRHRDGHNWNDLVAAAAFNYCNLQRFLPISSLKPFLEGKTFLSLATCKPLKRKQLTELVKKRNNAWGS